MYGLDYLINEKDYLTLGILLLIVIIFTKPLYNGNNNKR